MLYKYLHDTTHIIIFRFEKKKKKERGYKESKNEKCCRFSSRKQQYTTSWLFFTRMHIVLQNHDSSSSSYFLSKVHGKVAFFTAGSQTSSDFKLISYSSTKVSFLPFFQAFFIHIHCVVKQVKVEFFFLLLLNIVNKHFRAEKYRPRTSYVQLA